MVEGLIVPTRRRADYGFGSGRRASLDTRSISHPRYNRLSFSSYPMTAEISAFIVGMVKTMNDDFR